MSATVIVGGGLAGASAACMLAAGGRRVALFERNAAPTHKICGEFISAEAQRYLDRIGVDIATLGAHRITALRLVHRNKVATSVLPFAAFGLSRRRLDETLLCRAAALGADIWRGESIRLRQDGGPLVLETAAGLELRPETLFLATGKHDLRGLRRKTTRPNDLVGFKVHLRLAPAQIAKLAGHVELIMLPDGYAGLQLVEGNLANLCLLASSGRLRRAGGTWEGLFDDLLQTDPHLNTRLSGALMAGKPISIFRVPYGFVHKSGRTDPTGVFRIGDQMGVIPSFTGDGMSIALHSAVLAASFHLAGNSAADYHRTMRGDIIGQVRRARFLDRIATTGAGRVILMRLAAAWPSGMRLAARLTRVPPGALTRPVVTDLY